MENFHSFWWPISNQRFFISFIFFPQCLQNLSFLLMAPKQLVHVKGILVAHKGQYIHLIWSGSSHLLQVN
eukprot:UN03857